MKMKMKMPGGKDITGTYLPMAGGALAAPVIKNTVAKLMKKDKNSKMMQAVPVLAGIFLSMQSNAMMRNAGFGMFSGGITDLGESSIPALQGYKDMDLSGIFGDPLHDEVSDDINDEVGDEMNDELNDDMSEDVAGDILNGTDNWDSY